MYSNNSFHFFYSIVTTSLYNVSKSTGFNLNTIIQLAYDLILAGIIVYFWEINIIETVPLAIKCLLFKNNYAKYGFASFIFIYPITSSNTKRTFMWDYYYCSGLNFDTILFSIQSTSGLSYKLTFFFPFVVASTFKKVPCFFELPIRVCKTPTEKNFCSLSN